MTGPGRYWGVWGRAWREERRLGRDVREEGVISRIVTISIFEGIHIIYEIHVEERKKVGGGERNRTAGWETWRTVGMITI